MAKYIVASPIGLLICPYSNPDTLQLIEFKGSNDQQAETYYNLMESGDLGDSLHQLPKDEALVTDQRFLYEAMHKTGEFKTLELENQKTTGPVRIYLQKALKDRETQIDDIGRLVASLTVQRHTEARDVYLGQAIHAIDDLTKTLNLMSNRLKEWYGVHFPEMFDLVGDLPQYFRLVQIGTREDFNEENIEDLTEKKRARLLEAAKISLGSELEHEDFLPMGQLAEQAYALVKTKTALEKYIESTVPNVMPNTVALVGSLIAARLLALAGSLANLAKLPASTIQVLGAEKALFRHLKTGESPPKHGILFQAPSIHLAPFHQRGKLARALAGKISIAARIDYFSGEAHSSQLEADFKKRAEEIAKKFPKAPVRKKEPQRSRERPRDRQRSRDTTHGDRPWRRKEQSGGGSRFRQGGGERPRFGSDRPRPRSFGGGRPRDGRPRTEGGEKKAGGGGERKDRGPEDRRRRPPGKNRKPREQ